MLAYGGVPGAPEMSAAEIRAVAEVVHRGGLRLAAHAHGAQSIADSIRAGADTIEHASFLDDEGTALIAVEGDPLRDIAALERVEVVVQGGRVVERAAP